jgi:hypothetical protein
LNQGDYSFCPRSRIGCTCNHPCYYYLDQFLEKCGVRKGFGVTIDVTGSGLSSDPWPPSVSAGDTSVWKVTGSSWCPPESPLSEWADATYWWETVPINGSLSVSSSESESHSLPCIGDGTALAACRVRAILQHFFPKSH